MSDALCGPSNALQNFKNHSSVDRTLQQDRLVSRQQPGQGFRSHDPNTGVLDPEFEAFQAGLPASNFQPFGPSQPLHQLQPLQHVGPSFAGPSQAPAWASDFQNMHISSPPPPQQQQMRTPKNAAWASQFQQPTGKSPVASGLATPGMQYNTTPSFGMNRGFMSGFPQQTQFQPQQAQQTQTMQTMQAQKQYFDEAAFEAAFDAAMQDAFQSQEQQLVPEEAEQSARPDKFEVYPHLPLIRLALLKAIVTGNKPGNDYVLHEAAMFVQQLSRHDYNNIDPIQAMLLRPLITRLADTSRSHFAQRYQMSDLLHNMSESFREKEKDAEISPENERLLAAYADCLWGRDQSNHLSHMPNADADSQYWRVSLEEHMENWNEQDPTDQAMKMLSETNLFGLETPAAMQPVLDLEVAAYRTKLTVSGHYTNLPGSEDPQSLLYNMARILRDDIDVEQSLNRIRNAQHESSKSQDYQAKLLALEAENRARLLQQRTEADAATNQEFIDQAVNVHRPTQRGLSALPDYQAQLRLLEAQNAKRQAQWAREEAMSAQAESQRDAIQDMQSPLNHTEVVGDPLQQMQEEPLDEGSQQKDQQTKEDDDLARTAADLLDKVSHDKSSKFQNSSFLSLMRKFADREVKVRDDKVVEADYQNSATIPQREQQSAPTSWSQSGPMQTTSFDLPQSQAIPPADGQAVIDILNSPYDPHDQGTSSSPTLPADYASMAYATPSYPSWTWADSV